VSLVKSVRSVEAGLVSLQLRAMWFNWCGS